MSFPSISKKNKSVSCFFLAYKLIIRGAIDYDSKRSIFKGFGVSAGKGDVHRRPSLGFSTRFFKS